MTPARAQAGFTLLDSLAGLAVMGVILMGLATISGQWLPHWRRGFDAAQNADLIAQALDRAAADVAAAEYAHLDAGPVPLFRGETDALAFVRSAIGPGATPKLELVRIGAGPDGETTRARAAFAPGAAGATGGGFKDAATLLRAPFKLRFSYQSREGRWAPTWSGQALLPRAVKLTVTGAGGATVAETAALLHVTAPLQIAQPAAGPRPERSD